MSCIYCEEFQESDRTMYYRWKNANIEIRGCEKHVKEIMDILNDIQQGLR